LLGIGKAMNVLAARPQVARRGELQGTATTLQLDDVLYASFAPRPLADDDRPAVILQTGRDNLARTGAEVIHQHRHREAFEGSLRVGFPNSGFAVAPLSA